MVVAFYCCRMWPKRPEKSNLTRASKYLTHVGLFAALVLGGIAAHGAGSKTRDCGAIALRPAASGQSLDPRIAEILKQDGFLPAEIAKIQRESSFKVDLLLKHSAQYESIYDMIQPTRYDSPGPAGTISPSEAIEVLPFLIARYPALDMAKWLNRTFDLARAEKGNIMIAFARWAELVDDYLRLQLQPKVVAQLKAEIMGYANLSIVVDKYMRLFLFSDDEVKGLYDQLWSYSSSLQAITFMPFPEYHLQHIERIYKIPDQPLQRVSLQPGRIQLVRHTQSACGNCREMPRGHAYTLLGPDEDYGRSAAIRVDGHIIGMIKGVGDPSFLCLRNVDLGNGQMLWAGGVYQTDLIVVNQVLSKLEKGAKFPVIDFTSLRLKPVSFIYANGPGPWAGVKYQDWFAEIQKHLINSIPKLN